MWKVVVIYMAKLAILEDDEKSARRMFNQCEYNDFALFAFLYNSKGNLEETYIKTIER